MARFILRTFNVQPSTFNFEDRDIHLPKTTRSRRLKVLLHDESGHLQANCSGEHFLAAVRRSAFGSRADSRPVRVRFEPHLHWRTQRRDREKIREHTRSAELAG